MEPAMKQNGISDEVKNAGRERNTIGRTEDRHASSHGDQKTESRSAGTGDDGRSGRVVGSDDRRSGSESGKS
jgi:hypothetical protein